MHRKRYILIGFGILLAASCVWMFWKSAPLDLSNDEEPFRSMVMPPKSVQGDIYMDGGSVMVLVTDHTGTQYPITFPFDHTGIRNAHPTAFHGDINAAKMVPLKNPSRAKEIAIRLLKDHAKFESDPDFLLSADTMALRALSNPPHVVAFRATDRIKRIFH